MEYERRYFPSEMRVQRQDEGPALVQGHGAVFNQLSEVMFGFREQIAPGAFDDVLGDDVRALFNHDSNLILARSTSNTLRLNVDREGLAYEYDSPDTSYARDLLVSLERGDVTQSSFGFAIAEEDWDEADENNVVRTIVKVKRLYDVSPVTYPAYPDTDVAKRHLEAWRDAQRYQSKIDRAREYHARTRAILGPRWWNRAGKNIGSGGP